MPRFVPIIIQVKEGTSEQTVRQLTNAFKQLDREVKETSHSASGLSFANISGAVALGNLATNAFSRLTDILGQGARAVLDYSSQLETTKIAFTTMLGSAELATAHLKELQAFALKTPFQFSELTAASQRMQALGFQAEQIVPILNDVGNAVAAAGGGSERLDRVVLALSQIQSKGKVATQELNQLAESGISGWKILQAQIGKSRDELVDMVEKGKISSAVFLEAFQKFSQQNFGGLMEAQSKTFSGAMSNIKDALLQTSATAFEPLYAKLSELARQMADTSTKSKEFRKDMEEVGKALAQMWDGAIELIHIVHDAYRLVLSAIVGQIGLMIHSFQALMRAIQAAAFALEAFVRLGFGDLVGAGIAIEKSNQQARLSVLEMRDALISASAAGNELINIWGRFGERVLTVAQNVVAARAILIAQEAATGANVLGAGITIGGGITRPKSSSFGGGGGGGGASEGARTAERLAELNLKVVMNGLRAEEDALKRSLERRLVDYDVYTAKLEILENDRHQLVIAALLTEKEAILSQKNNAVGLKEVDIKAQEESIRHDQAVLKLKDQIADTMLGMLATAESTIDAFIRLNEETNRMREAALFGPVPTATADLEKFIEKTTPPEISATTQALLDMRERVRNVADDIGDIFGRAVEDWSGSFSSFFGSIGRGFADMAKRLIATAVFTSVSNSFRNLLGVGTGQQSGGGAGNILASIFGGGGGGSTVTGGFAGGPGAAQILGGGISTPSSIAGQQSSIQQIAAIAQGNVTGGGAAAAGGFSLGSLATAAPFLGAALGVGVGTSLGRGASPLASILGGVGLGAVGLVTGSALPAILAGSFAGLTALGAVTFGAGAALAVAAYIIGRNAARRRDERTRDAISHDTGTAIWALIARAQRGDLSITQARQEWSEIESNYKSQIAQIRDSKTRRHAELQWQNDFAPLWSKVEQNARQGEAASAFSSSFIPTFASGGLVPYFGGRQTLIKVRPGERIDDVGAMRSWWVPGVDTGRDSVVTAATPGSAVRTRAQQRRIPGFAGGTNAPAVASGNSRGGDIVFQTNNEAVRAILELLFKGVTSPDGRRAIVEAVRGHVDNTGLDGLAGDVLMATQRR